MTRCNSTLSISRQPAGVNVAPSSGGGLLCPRAGPFDTGVTVGIKSVAGASRQGGARDIEGGMGWSQEA